MVDPFLPLRAYFPCFRAPVFITGFLSLQARACIALRIRFLLYDLPVDRLTASRRCSSPLPLLASKPLPLG